MRAKYSPQEQVIAVEVQRVVNGAEVVSEGSG